MDSYSSVQPPYLRQPPPHLARENDPYAQSFVPAPNAAPRREPALFPSAASSSSYYRQQQQQQQQQSQPPTYGYASDGRQTYLPPASSSRRRSRSPAYRSEQIASSSTAAAANRPSRDYLPHASSAYRDNRRYSPLHDQQQQYPAHLPSTSRSAETYPALDLSERHHYPPTASRPSSVQQQQQQQHASAGPPRFSVLEHRTASGSSHQYPSSTYQPSYDMSRAAAAASSTTGSATTVASSRTRRKQDAAASSATTSASLRTLPSTTRTPRVAGSTVSTSSAVGYKVEKHQLPTGDVRDVIILEDTPPPSGRTRAKAAAAAGNGGNGASYRQPVASGSGASYQQQQALPPPTTTAGASRKRKAEEPGAGAVKASRTTVNGTSSRTATAVAPPPPPKAPPCDDAEGHYIINMGDIVHDRYRIVRKLGEGTFGKVVECVDRRQPERKYAVKIIRAVQKYRDASKIEIRVLNELKRGDPYNENKCIHLTEVFDHKNHVCLVFELLGSSVFDFLKENSFVPFPMAHIQDFAHQLLTSVAYMHRLGLVHTDLKPENILLADSSYRSVPSRTAPNEKKLLLNNTDIRLIDFGSATFEREYHSTVVSTRHYRAPEIIFGLGWSYPCDMFSIGCILVEFFTGEALFQTHGNLEHLVMMEIVMGKMPADFMRRGARAKPEFFKGNKLDYPNATTDKASKKFLKGMKTLEAIIPQQHITGQRFCDLIRRLLHFDPEKRIDVRTALAHPFFQVHIPLE